MAFQQPTPPPHNCRKSGENPHIQAHGADIPAQPLRTENFPAGIHVLCDNIDRLQGPLFPKEMDIVHKAVQKRQREFTAGRTLARRAISHFGIQDQPILHDNRMPVWPEAVTGSISHCNTHCAVAVGLRSSFLSIGIDIETAGMVSPDLWEHTFTPNERDDISTAPPARRNFLATVIFSAKEAFFKLQYPLTGEWVGFEEAFVQVPDNNRFRITCNKHLKTIPPVLHGVIMKPLPSLVLSLLWMPAGS